MGFPGVSVVKNSPANQELTEMWAGSLGQEDLGEEGMAPLSSILARKIPWTEDPSRLSSMVSQESDMT